mmetsp:Transcript_121181/g.388142  ORF Transcript_121181/g.388142 Transcript_121181/m.388142 type:complete len:565 (+) Transcript_121181:198-1892(+)
MCVLAVFLWLTTVMQDVRANCRFLGALLHLPRGSQTLIGQCVSTIDGSSASEGASILMISHVRVWCTVLFAVVPRFMVAACLTFLGTKYLVFSASMSDLLLNAMALEFVTAIDELLFAAFAPMRLKALIRNIEALEVPIAPWCKRAPSLVPWVCLLSVLLLLNYFWDGVIHDFMGRAELAEDFMCGGEQNFVYTKNPINGVIMATSSEPNHPDDDFDTVASILNLAQLDLKDAYGFKVPEALVGIADRPQTAMIQVGPKLAAEEWERAGTYAGIFNRSLGSLPAENAAFVRLSMLSTGKPSEAAEFLPCNDGAGTTGHVLKAQVEKIFGYTMENMTGMNSKEVCQSLVDNCDGMNMTSLRALCPVSCGCHLWWDPPAAFYAVTEHGCPTDCRTLMTVTRKSGVFGRDNCTDVAPSAFGDGALHKYMHGVLEYVYAYPERAPTVQKSFRVLIYNNYLAYSIPVTNLLKREMRNVTNFLLSRKFIDSMVSERWELYAGVPHPRNLTGCDFVTSWEFAAIFQLDLCETGAGYRSIRTYCPEACRCTPDAPECPVAGCGALPTPAPAV